MRLFTNCDALDASASGAFVAGAWIVFLAGSGRIEGEVIGNEKGI